MTTKAFTLLLAPTLLLYPLVIIPVFGFVVFLGLSVLFIPVVLAKGKNTDQVVCSRFAVAFWILGGCAWQGLAWKMNTFGVPDVLGYAFAVGGTWGSVAAFMLAVVLVRGWYWTTSK